MEDAERMSAPPLLLTNLKNGKADMYRLYRYRRAKYIPMRLLVMYWFEDTNVMYQNNEY
jgi:hypothetical protein